MAIVTISTSNSRPPPINEATLIGWMRMHLFSSPLNSILTILTTYIIYLTVSGVWVWGVVDAIWIADTRRECFDINISGACWAGVSAWMENIFYGRYPREEIWRIDFGLFLLFLWMAPLWMPRVRGKVIIGMTTVFLYPFLAGYLFSGGDKGIFMSVMVSAAIVGIIANTLNATLGVLADRSLSNFVNNKLGFGNAPEEKQQKVFLIFLAVCFVLAYIWQSGWQAEIVSWTKWGGLFLTLVISGIGIASALPGGIILAMGRRSKLPVIRVLSTAFIELFRSVPLITVLFMATTMFPLFMPEGVVLNKLVQVIIAVCLFNACYMAETVRAGLQAIPKGQAEGAHTIGLGYWGTMGLIVMPQALKHMIPNIVGSFMGLLKDTTLVSIIGLFDILGMLRSISRDTPWLGLHKEPLVFGAMLFFIICFAMSKYSRHLEAKLSTGHKV